MRKPEKKIIDTPNGTKFLKENFRIDAGWIIYHDMSINCDREFIARCRNQADAAVFSTFILRNFTVQEYLALHDGGLAPLNILETKGFISPGKKRFKKAQKAQAERQAFVDGLSYKRAI